MESPFWRAGAVLLASLAGAHAADTLVWKSGPEQTALLELFTSEGCSSCPPAERWLSRLTTDKALWHEVVPVEFHVDYWDNLGWVDRFATPENTERQQRYAASWRRPSVYTPGFVLNGGEWRNWFGLSGFPSGERLKTGVLEVSRQGTNQISVTYSVAPENRHTGNLEVTAAWLGGDVASDVRRGENAGSKLRHPFVALRTVTVPLSLKDGGHSAMLTLPRVPSQDSGHLGLAVWVSRANRQAPEQAVGGWWPQ